jgi:hypothetical protein
VDTGSGYLPARAVNPSSDQTFYARQPEPVYKVCSKNLVRVGVIRNQRDCASAPEDGQNPVTLGSTLRGRSHARVEHV